MSGPLTGRPRFVRGLRSKPSGNSRIANRRKAKYTARSLLAAAFASKDT